MKMFNHVIFHDAIWISVVAAGPNFSRTSSSYFNHEPHHVSSQVNSVSHCLVQYKVSICPQGKSTLYRTQAGLHGKKKKKRYRTMYLKLKYMHTQKRKNYSPIDNPVSDFSSLWSNILSLVFLPRLRKLNEKGT